MENQLKELLERKSADVVAGPGVPQGLLRQSRRRRVRTALLTVVIGGALGPGGFFGARAAIDAVRSDRGTTLQPAGEDEKSSPPPGGSGTEAVRDFVQAFMAARIDGSGAEEYLSTEAKRQYDEGEGGLALYSPVSNPHYGNAEILRLGAVDASSYEVTVRIAEELYPWPGLGVGSLMETLFVGPGETYRGVRADLVVRGAMRDDTITFPTRREASDLVGQFMISRFENDQAERFLAREAADQYEAGAEGISLYEPSQQPQWVSFDILSIESAEADQYEVAVHVVVAYSSSGEHDSFTEVIVVGPGRTVDDIEARLVVREAYREA